MKFFHFSFVKNTTLKNKRFSPASFVCTSQLLSPAPRKKKNRFTTNSCHVTVYVISRRSLHQPRRECERSIVIVHYLATGSVLLPKVFDLFLISADKWKMPEAIPQMMPLME